MIRRPPRSTLFPSRRSSDLGHDQRLLGAVLPHAQGVPHELAARGPGEVAHVVGPEHPGLLAARLALLDRKSTRLNSSHSQISYAVFCLKKKKQPCHAQYGRT